MPPRYAPKSQPQAGGVKSKKWLHISQILTLPLIGALLTILLQQFFLKTNKRTEETIKIQAEYVKENLALLNKIKKFQEAGDPFVAIRIHSTYSVGEEKTFATDSVGFDMELPQLALDTSQFRYWVNLYSEIEKSESLIDRDLFMACKNVRDFLNENPLPRQCNNYETVEYSGWNDGQIKGRWKTLVKILEMKIDRRLALIKDDSEIAL